MIFLISFILSGVAVGLAAQHATFLNGHVAVALATFVGACAGSFLNVVAYRYPIMLKRGYVAGCRDYLGLPPEPTGETFNLAFPKSHCPCCKRPVKAHELVPVLSYAFLRGRCAGCRSPISVRYAAVEMLCAALTAVAVSLFGLTWVAGAVCIFIWVSIAIALIDADTLEIPDELSQPLLWAGILASSAGFGPTHTDPVMGAAVGFGFLWVMCAAYKLVRGKDGMGVGDFKYLAAAGAFLGWKAVFLIVVIAGLSGTITGLARAVRAGKDSLGKPLPFGPHLVAGAIFTLLAYSWLVKLKFLSGLAV